MVQLKLLNHRKILQKTQKNNSLLKAKRTLKPKYKLSGGTVFTFTLPGGRFAPMYPRQLRPYQLAATDGMIACYAEQ